MIDYKEWVKGLHSGDKIIVRCGLCTYIDNVKKVTSKGWVVTENHGTYSPGSWSGRYIELGGNKDIIPYDDDWAKIAIDCKRQLEQKKAVETAIRKAKNLMYDLCYSKRKLDFELAKKIIDLIENETEEP